MAARDVRLLLGPFAAALFTVGVAVLPGFIPGHDAVRQTVSEIGEIGSPMRWPFAVLLWVVALCLMGFAGGLWIEARRTHRGVLGALAALCTAWMGVAAGALGWFAHPHSLHNLFGLSELIAYQAPLFFVLAWRRAPRTGVVFSAIMYALTIMSIAANLYAIADNGVFWQTVGPYYGLMQRALFACFFLWCAGVGWLLWRRPRA